MDWKLADAKTRFSEVVRRALTEGPQRVLRRKDVVVVLSEADYERLSGQKPTLVEFLASGPSWGALELERNSEPLRDLDL